MIFPLIVTLIIVSPVTGFIAAYQCLYSHMPCEHINNLNRVGVEKDNIVIEEDIIEAEENDIRVPEDTIGADRRIMGVKEDYIGIEQDNIIIFFNNNVRIE